jgi:ATP-dependent 26S proteasome regulatory subunit
VPESQEGQPDDPFAALREWGAAWELEPFDLSLLLIALGPEVDVRFTRAFDSGGVTVQQALDLLCNSVEEKIERRRHLEPGAPLIRNAVLYLAGEGGGFPGYRIHLEPQALRLLLGRNTLDPRLWRWCEVETPEAGQSTLALAPGTVAGLRGLVTFYEYETLPLRIYLHGAGLKLKREAAAAIAAESGRVLLTLNGKGLASSGAETQERLLRIFFRESLRLNALPFIGDADALPVRLVTDAFTLEGGPALLAGEDAAWAPASSGMLGVAVPRPAVSERRLLWQRSLAMASIEAVTGDVEILAGRFQLTADEIAGAVAHAQREAAFQGESVTLDHLLQASRAAGNHELAGVAIKVEPRRTWDDLVLPPDQIEQLQEICSRVEFRDEVLEQRGFARHMTYGRGITVLFTGPSGTGKTMAAEVLARQLALDLYKVDLAGLVSKYIGETEKNLDRVFRAAEGSNVILLFDEADALFGKRAETKDAHDRYANLEVSYLLQRMEAYEGVAILATNLRSNLDEAFLRRLSFTVQFPFPDTLHRRRIWERVWPRGTAFASDVDFGRLAELKFNGGNIRNVSLAAAFFAAARGECITMDGLLHGTRREYQKMGQNFARHDLLPFVFPREATA